MVEGELRATNKVIYYLSRMASRGIDAEQVLDGTGLQVEPESQEGFRPSPEQYRTLIHNMLHLTGDSYLGIALGKEFKVSDLGVLGYAALSASNMEQTRELFTRYGVLNEHLVTTTNHITRGQWYSEIKEMFPLGDLLPFAVEEYVSQTMSLGSSISNKPFPILEMHLTYSQPADLSPYVESFNCPLYFNQPRNMIMFDINHLKDPVSMASEEVFNLCEQQCKRLVDQLAASDLLSSKIRNTLVKNPGKFPVLEEVAEQLNMGARTLRRRLLDEDLTYQQILDDTRKDLAIQYLKYTQLAPKEIGFLLGYSSVSNFRRAFKSWTGKKLTDFRQDAE